MKFSQVLHIISILVGFVGVVTFLAAVFGGADDSVFGVTKFDALFCTAILFLIAIWATIGSMQHMMLEKRGQIL